MNFDPDTCDAISAFREEVARLRDSGKILLAVEPIHLLDLWGEESDESKIIRLVGQLGYPTFAQNWYSISNAEALYRVRGMLMYDAFFYRPIMPEGVAGALAERFMSFFVDGRYFSSAVRLSDSTIEDGAVAINESRIGIMWAFDED